MLKLSAAEWPKHGINAEILATGASVGEYADTLRQAGWTVHHLPFRKSPSFFAQLRGFLRRGRYDVVHLHAERAFPYFVLAAKAAGVPRIVRTIHNAFSFTGGLRTRRAVQRRLLARLGVVSTAVSRSVQQHERESFGNETVYISNWYDSDYFVPPSEQERLAARQRIGIAEGEFVLVSVSNCAPAKNHQGILEALTLLPQNLHFRYIHIGHGASAVQEQEYALKNHLEDRVVFSGQQSDVRPFLWAADCFLMPSLYEGIGISAIEGIATGLPAVLSDVLGLRDFKEWCRGIVWTGTSAESIAAGIVSVMDRLDAEHRKIPLPDSASVRAAFSMANSVVQISTLYKG